MHKGSKRPGWRALERRYTAITAEIKAQAAAAAPPPIHTCAPPPPPPKPARPKRTPRPKPEPTAREAAIRAWYLYGTADEPPPEGLTEQELAAVRRRFC